MFRYTHIETDEACDIAAAGHQIVVRRQRAARELEPQQCAHGQARRSRRRAWAANVAEAALIGFAAVLEFALKAIIAFFSTLALPLAAECFCFVGAVIFGSVGAVGQGLSALLSGAGSWCFAHSHIFAMTSRILALATAPRALQASARVVPKADAVLAKVER